MGKKTAIQFRDRTIWAFDLVAGVFLKHLIDAAETKVAQRSDEWLVDCISRWRVNAVVNDYGLHLDEAWSIDQIAAVTSLIGTACEVLASKEELSAREIEAWPVLDEHRLSPRGLAIVDTTSIVRFGEAIIQLLNNTLPPSPPDTSWFFGTADAPRAMTKLER